MKSFTAVLHLKSKDPQKVYQLAGKVSSNLTTNATIFTDPDPKMADFTTEVTKLDTLIKSKDGSKQKNQAIEDQTNVVYGMLKALIIYTNKVANGDKTIVLLSGFDCNNEPASRQIPGKGLIKRVEDGSVVCSAKIYVESLPDADRYKIEITSNLAEPSSWKTLLDFGSLNRLEIRDLLRGQEIYIRVSGGNTWGWGVPSEPVAFIPR